MNRPFSGYPPPSLPPNPNLPNLPPNPTSYLPPRPQSDPGLPPQPLPYNAGPPPPSQSYGSSSIGPSNYLDKGPPPRDNFVPRGAGGARRGRGRSPDGRPRRRLADRDHSSIEQRVNRERPCRTLFIRNVTFEADSEGLRASFAGSGDIKTYFDLVKNRGMIFITYFDLRAAEKARDGMHNTEIGGRMIDVHYSLPRADEQTGRCDGDKNQGSIMVSLRHQRAINEYELGRLCERFGDVKSIRPCRESDQKIVEYFDSRGAALFHDELQDKPFMQGTLDLRFVWDELDSELPPPPAPERMRETSIISDHSQPLPGGREPRRSGEGPGYGKVRGGGYRAPPEYGPSGEDRRGSYPPGPPQAPEARYGELPPRPPLVDDRLEQARKVQQLLATLGANAAPPAPVPTPPQAQPRPPMQSNYNAPPPNRYPAPSPRPPPAQNAPVYARNDPRSSYPPLNPPPPMSNGYSQGPSRPPSGYPLYPPPAASPSRPPPPTHASHLPPPGHVGMMQHQQQQQQRPGQPPPQLSQGFMPPSQSSRPPYEAPGYPPAAANGNAQGYGSGLEGAAKDVGSLLAMLQSTR